MATQTNENPIIPEFELTVRLENLTVAQDENDLLEVSAHSIVYGFGKTASKNILLRDVNPTYSPESLLEKILDGVKEHLAESLVATYQANLVECVYHALGSEEKDAIKKAELKKNARESFLKIHKENFNGRNKIPKSSRQVTEEQFFNKAILALKKLNESGIKSPTEAEFAEALDCSIENFKKYIKKFPVFTIEDALKDVPEKNGIKAS